MASWWVEYSQEAANYLEDNGALVTALFFAIEALAETEGLPTAGLILGEADEVIFEAENHIIPYEREESAQIVRITIIRPK